MKWQKESFEALVDWYRSEVKSLWDDKYFFQERVEADTDLIENLNMELGVKEEHLRAERETKAAMQRELEEKSQYAEMLRGNLLALSTSVNA